MTAKPVEANKDGDTLSLLALIRSDLVANGRNPKGILLTTLYRIARACVDVPAYLRPVGWLYVLFYKVVTEYVLGTEIHWRTTIGPGLRVFHGYGLVVHDGALIGANCTLRQGVTIGAKSTSENRSAPVIGENVDVGASAIIIGKITIGDGCTIGAGAVVVRNLPPCSVAVGNPARILRISASSNKFDCE